MNLDLAGRAFLVTGGTDGLGLALARRLVEEGARVAVCGRDAARLDAAQVALGGDALCVGADVTDPADCAALVDAALDRFARLDGLVNNAGRSSASPVADSTDESWREDVELKVVAAVRLARLALPALEATGGSVLNVLATLARTPAAGSTPSSAARAAGLALTKALAGEVGPRGVRANAILIGLIESGQWERRASASGLSVEELYGRVLDSSPVPLGRFGRAEEFADLAAFVLSPRASYLTGVGIALDGGLSPAI